jgi:hypothetical protein
MAIRFPSTDEAPRPRLGLCRVVRRCRLPARYRLWAEGPLGVVDTESCGHHLERALAIGWRQGGRPVTCRWEYCARQATLVVECHGDDGVEREPVCGDHAAHAQAKGWSVAA